MGPSDYKVLKPRARLTEHDVLSIFRCKYSSATATKLASVYGVSEKAVRDIWTGRTWARETWHLETSGGLPAQPMGRSGGSKTAKNRIPQSKQSSILNDVSMLKEKLKSYVPHSSLSLFRTIKSDRTLDEILFDWENTEGCLTFQRQLSWKDPFKDDWNVARSNFGLSRAS